MPQFGGTLSSIPRTSEFRDNLQMLQNNIRTLNQINRKPMHVIIPENNGLLKDWNVLVSHRAIFVFARFIL